MKHIEKKFLLQRQVDSKEEDKLNETLAFKSFEDLEESDLKEGFKDNLVFASTENGYLFPIINQKIDGLQCYIPMPDPTLMYFNNAQNSYRHIKELRTELKEKLGFKNIQDEPYINEIYNYFGQTSQFVIFLFTSIESFINQMIPVNYTYQIESSRRTEVYNSEQIQRFISFNDKMKKVLPKCTDKNFFSKQTKNTQHIDNLKNFRDEIIHTKKDTKHSTLFYDSLVSKSLSFKYEETIRAVQMFMNFYKPDYVVECGCGEDF